MLASKLKKGDTIGVIAPDKALKSSDRVYLEKASEFFKSLGLKIKYGKYLFSDENYCAGNPEERAKDVNDMFADGNVKAIFTVKGGDLANGVLPFLDYENIKYNPKMFLGMSDISVLLCAIYKMTGLITYHCNDYLYYGTDKVTDYDKNEIMDKLFEGNKIIFPYNERNFVNFGDKIITGKCFGTNVVGLQKLFGTPYMIDLENSILFLEGYKSNIVQWNSFLEHYNQIGAINQAIVFGYIYQLEFAEKGKFDVVEELLKINDKVPIVKTNDFGHEHPNSIIPIGVKMKIDAVNKNIEIVEEYLK